MNPNRRGSLNVIDDPRRHLEHDVIVTAGVHRLADAAALDAKRSRHPEVHDQRVTGGQGREQIFGAPVEAEHRPPLQSRGESSGERGPEIRPPQEDAHESRAGHRRLELAAD